MNVLFIDTVHPVINERLEAANYQCIDATDKTFEECCRLAGEAEGIVIRSRFRMDEKLLQHAPHLRFIARSGAGMENIDEAYCKARNIFLINAPEGNRNAVAEHALGMLLSLFNRFCKADHEVRNGIWDREGNRGIELDGKTVGIIGYGNNGSAFARKLRGFDISLLAYDKYITGYGDDFVKESTLQEIFNKADVISFHIPQNEETMYMVNDDFINNVQKPFYLLNLSRGKIVETAALIKGIETGKIRGAGLDVLEYEKSSFENFTASELPEAFNQLLKSDKVLLSPHVGGWTQESYFKLSNIMADKILSQFGYIDRQQ